MRNQLTHDRLELGIDIDIGPDDRFGQHSIETGKGIQRLAHHPERRFGDMTDTHTVFGRRLSCRADSAHAFGYFFGFVAHPLKVGHDFCNAEYQP